MKTVSLIISILFIGILIGCSTSSVRVESQPDGADVYVHVNGQSSKKIGATPITITEQQVNPGNDSFQISILKDGYLSEHILAPATVFSRSSSVQVKLKENLNNKTNLSDETIQKVTSQVATSLSMLRNKDLEGAERSLLNLTSSYPNIATVHELLGNVYYLKKDLSRAHSSYKRALILNPSNSDTQRMILKIEDIRNDLRSPASSQGGF